MVTEITNRLSVPVPQQGSRANAAEQTRQNAAATRQAITEPQTVPETPGRPVAAAELNEAVVNINNFVQSVSRDLQFSVDETTDRVVIKVLDSQTEEVIREIPSEEALALARYLTEQQETATTRLEGLILQVRA